MTETIKNVNGTSSETVKVIFNLTADFKIINNLKNAMLKQGN